ncbi:MAG TPA: hypothetical protein VFG87_27550 [Amycolatopsis sp.]|nr:hypothetical protein [Amycolatopsis sp.]
MKASLFVFGTDLVHEGYDTVLGNLADRAGVQAVSLSATYHNARDVFPHNPKHRVYRHEGDIAWFVPRPATYPAGMVPPLAEDADGVDVLAELGRRAPRRGLEVQAWTIFTHNSRVGATNPDCTVRNVYGDTSRGDLCPANPKVREYFLALAADICRYPVTRLLAECLHYRPFEHGEHHERYLIDLPAAARTLLGLCFCPHCRHAGAAAGVDVDGLAAGIRQALEPVWAGAAMPALEPAAARELDGYLTARETTVANVTKDVRAVVSAAGVELGFIDHAGAMAQVMTGTPADESPLVPARKLGVAPDRVAAEADELAVLGYAATPERVASMLTAYRDKIGRTPLAVALRPLLPDCATPGNLAAKVKAVKDSGAHRVDFYHYAMAPLDRLDWIAAALTT